MNFGAEKSKAEAQTWEKQHLFFLEANSVHLKMYKYIDDK